MRRALSAAALAVLSAPTAAAASACCAGAGTPGFERLSMWEDLAGGVRTTFEHAVGTFDGRARFATDDAYAEQSLRAQAWGIARLHRDLSVEARVPWVTTHREAGDLEETAHGLGDAQLGLRWQAFPTYGRLGLAVVGALTVPTGVTPEEADGPLGAGATGRGAFVPTLGLSAERAAGRVFLRLDAAVSAPLEVEVEGHTRRDGLFGQAAFVVGRPLDADFTVAGAARVLWQSAAQRDGATLPDSASREVGISASVGYRATGHVTLQAAFEAPLPFDGLGMNRSALVAATLGVRAAL